MITLNIVYLAAAAPLLGLTLFGLQISDRAARHSMFTGLIIPRCHSSCRL
jgi:solute:Na+ symporter, SSS family